MSSRLHLVAGAVAALALGACASASDAPPGPSASEPAAGAPGEGEAASGPAEDRLTSMEGGRIGHWDLLIKEGLVALEQGGPDGGPVPFVDGLIARGKHLEVRLLIAQGRVPAPQVAADEVIIFIDGEPRPPLPGAEPAHPCFLLVEGKRVEVKPGTIAVLPAGTRGALQPWSQSGPVPLCAIVARTTTPRPRAPGAKPWIADLGALDPLLKPAHTPFKVQPSASIPGRIGLFTYTVCHQNKPRFRAGLVPNQRHAAHDELLLILTGEGNIGLGDAGHRVKAKSIVLIPQGLLYNFENDDLRGTRALLVASPPVAGTDVQYEIIGPEEPVREAGPLVLPDDPRLPNPDLPSRRGVPQGGDTVQPPSEPAPPR